MVKPDIHTLAHHLKQERLYVASEKQLIQRLNSDVLKTAERLYRAAWIAKQQRINLDRLILTRSNPYCCNSLCPHKSIVRGSTGRSQDGASLTYRLESREKWLGFVL